MTMDTILSITLGGGCKRLRAGWKLSSEHGFRGAERDEGDSSGSNFRRIKNQTADKEYDHYGVLKTIEDNFGLPPLTSGDGNAAPITEAWEVL